MSYSIFINVVDATLTVYAKAPDKIVFLSGRWGKKIPHCVLNGGANHDIVGHSFWKCETDVTNLSTSEKCTSGEKYGFYPAGGFDTGIKSLASKQGEIRNDNGHSITACKSYSIEFNSAKDFIQKKLKNQGIF